MRELNQINSIVPPQDIELERMVLGTALLNREALEEVVEALKPSDLYREPHQRILNAVMRLYANSEPIDMLSVKHQLTKSGEIDQIGGVTYLLELTDKHFNYTHELAYHIQTLREHAQRRDMIRVGGTLVQTGYRNDTDVPEALAKAEADLLAITSGVGKQPDKPFPQMIWDTAKKHEEIYKKQGVSGLLSGLKALDNVLGSFDAGKLYIIAGRPGMGKSLLKSNLTLFQMYQGHKPASFEYEMNEIQSTNRFVTIVSGMPANYITSGKYLESASSVQHVQKRMQELSELSLNLFDDVTINLKAIGSKLRRLKATTGLDIAYIDYLQLMPLTGLPQNGTRNDMIGEITGGLKRLAKELQIPIVLLSQLSRDVEKRGGAKIPTLADLRDSGSIEQDSDAVLFVYRPEYYNITHDKNGNSTKGLLRIIVAKNRDGSLGNADVEARLAHNTIKDFPNVEMLGELDFS